MNGAMMELWVAKDGPRSLQRISRGQFPTYEMQHTDKNTQQVLIWPKRFNICIEINTG